MDGVILQPMSDAVSLDQFIQDLRAQLEAAIMHRPKKGLHFEVGEIELELQLSQEKKTDGKLAFKVLGIGASKGQSVGHVVRLKLNPKVTDPEGSNQSLEVSQKDAEAAEGLEEYIAKTEGS